MKGRSKKDMEAHIDSKLAEFERRYEASKRMTEEEHQDLLQWEEENLDGCHVKTSDWPGWTKIIERIIH